MEKVMREILPLVYILNPKLKLISLFYVMINSINRDKLYRNKNGENS